MADNHIHSATNGTMADNHIHILYLTKRQQVLYSLHESLQLPLPRVRIRTVYRDASFYIEEKNKENEIIAFFGISLFYRQGKTYDGS